MNGLVLLLAPVLLIGTGYVVYKYIITKKPSREKTRFFFFED